MAKSLFEELGGKYEGERWKQENIRKPAMTQI